MRNNCLEVVIQCCCFCRNVDSGCVSFVNGISRLGTHGIAFEKLVCLSCSPPCCLPSSAQLQLSWTKWNVISDTLTQYIFYFTWYKKITGWPNRYIGKNNITACVSPHNGTCQCFVIHNPKITEHSHKHVFHECFEDAEQQHAKRCCPGVDQCFCSQKLINCFLDTLIHEHYF